MNRNPFPRIRPIHCNPLFTAVLDLRLALGLCAALVAVPAGAATAEDTAAVQKGIETADLNPQIDPCTDFYEYANGTWRAANPIPAAMSRWSRRQAAREANAARVQGLLEEISRKTDWPSGSVEQLVGDHYASCLDEKTIDAAGLAPLAPLLAEIDGVQDRDGVQRLIRRLHDLDIQVPFGTTGSFEYHEPGNYLLNFVAGTLGMGDRNEYSSQEPASVEARKKYRAHVAQVLELGGLSRPQSAKAADDILALETRLAAASLDGATAADPAATAHRTSFAQLEKLAPHLDWKRYFGEAELPRTDLNVAEPKLLQQIDQELTEAPVEVWKAYLRWHLLASASPWLSRPFAEAAAAFSGAAGKPRAQLCAESTDTLFGDALGKNYVERYFPPAARAKAQEIADNLLAALKELVAEGTWMQPETKKTALQKLEGTRVQLGHPDTWKDYAGVTVRRDTFWANVAAGRKFKVADLRRLVGKPTDRGLWLLSPSSPGAYIEPQLNVLVLPAGFLQPPYFDPAATDAVNYGSLGIGLAHDLTHGIDTLGADFDLQGRPKAWWTEADRKAFDQRAQCVIDQYEGYFIEPGVHHDGKRVLSEAIGDLGGVRVAYRALQKSMQGRPVPTVDGFTPQQQFFLAWAQTTGAAMSIEAQRKLVAGDSHPAPKFRILGPFSSVPEFQQAFSCKAGAAMVRPPEKRCLVW